MTGDNYHREILIGERFKEIRQYKGLTQKQFADSLGIVQGFLSGIERGKKNPSDTLIIALRNLYEINEEWLATGQGAMFSVAPFRQGGTGKGMSETPLLRQIPLGFPENRDDGNICGRLSLPKIPDGCYALFTQGDYMAPTVRDGDMIIFSPGGEAKNGDIVLINNKWGEAILRRYRVMGGKTVYSSDNPAYTPFKPDPDTRIIGAVVAIWRKMNF